MLPAIKVENLCKKYVVGQKERGYKTFREALVDIIKVPSKCIQKFNVDSSQDMYFWALKDINFEVKHGEVIGIIGRNGAGKSTLLKVLSRITEPTQGEVRISGRITSLLEVGTGFHPELTGRENIYLNGAILGMSRSEINRKFDEIVDFAEVEKFLDTPVKRYSSGMYVRLAFAVAAHLDSEILVVDEVLAVGDIQFQKKCLGKMQTIGNSGRTVIFVSHDMTAMQAFCSRVIRLNQGKLIGDGIAEEQISLYLKEMMGFKTNKSICNTRWIIDQSLQLLKFELSPNTIACRQDLDYHIEFSSNKRYKLDSIVILIYNSYGIRVGIVDLRNSQAKYIVDDNNLLVVSGKIKSIPLIEGEYSVGLFLDSVDVTGNFLDLTSFFVINRAVQQSDIIPYPANVRGLVEFDYYCSS
jgi:lipopolysaccharide transport system ATP-binding protein